MCAKAPATFQEADSVLEGKETAMHWPSTYHYAVILQQERLQRASESGRGLSVFWVAEWWRTLSKIRASRGRPARRIAVKGGSALPKSGSPT
jgi:hypothetical protein